MLQSEPRRDRAFPGRMLQASEMKFCYFPLQGDRRDDNLQN